MADESPPPTLPATDSSGDTAGAMPGFPFTDAPSHLFTPGGSIPYWVLYPEGYSERYARGVGGKTQVHIAVNWQDAADFKTYALGGTKTLNNTFSTVGGGGDFMLGRRAPLRAPWTQMQYLDELEAVKVGVASGSNHGPDPAADNWFRADWVVYQATFSAPPYEVLTDAEVDAFGFLYRNEMLRYVVRGQRFIPKERKVPNFRFVYDDGSNTYVPEVTFVPFYEYEFVYRWLEVPLGAVPHKAIALAAGKTNQDPFDTQFAGPNTYLPESILFKGLARPIEPYRHSDNKLYVDLYYLFGFIPVIVSSTNTTPRGWNYYPKNDGTYVPIKVDGTSPAVRPYPPTDVKGLFIPE